MYDKDNNLTGWESQPYDVTGTVEKDGGTLYYKAQTVPMLELVQEDGAEPVYRITLPELAAKFHLSQSSLKICFKALYGVPVASYLRGLRMDTAARLLQESDLPVAEIAHRVGYEDPSRLAAAIRRHTGRRPTELRRVACPTASSHTA